MKSRFVLVLGLLASCSQTTTPPASPGLPASLSVTGCSSTISALKGLSNSISIDLLTEDNDLVLCQTEASEQKVLINFGMNAFIDGGVNSALINSIISYNQMSDKAAKEANKDALRLAIHNFNSSLGYLSLTSSGDTIVIINTIRANMTASRISSSASAQIASKITASLTVNDAAAVSYLSAISSALTTISALPQGSQEEKLLLVSSKTVPSEVLAAAGASQTGGGSGGEPTTPSGKSITLSVPSPIGQCAFGGNSMYKVNLLVSGFSSSVSECDSDEETIEPYCYEVNLYEDGSYNQRTYKGVSDYGDYKPFTLDNSLSHFWISNWFTSTEQETFVKIIVLANGVKDNSVTTQGVMIIPPSSGYMGNCN